MNMSNRSKTVTAIAARPIDGPAPAGNIEIGYGDDVFNTDSIIRYLMCSAKFVNHLIINDFYSFFS